MILRQVLDKKMKMPGPAGLLKKSFPSPSGRRLKPAPAKAGDEGVLKTHA
jgi:hypothetical protein